MTELPGMWEAADLIGGQTDTECMAELVGAHCAAPYCKCDAVPVCVQTPTARITHDGTRETGR